MLSLFYDIYLAIEWWLAHRYLELWPDWSEYRRVRACYYSTGRYYHTWSHINSTCRFVRSHYGSQPLVILALFYHDIIYDINRKDNEKLSALEWEAYATRRQLHNQFSNVVKLVSELILMTKKHTVTPDQSETYAMMCDADMSIFLSQRAEYISYAQNIWREYSQFGPRKFIAGRTSFLETVKPEDMYYTPQAKAMVDIARANLDWERQILIRDPAHILSGLKVAPGREE